MIILPKDIHLTATGQHWKVSYMQAPCRLTIVEYPARKLVIYGDNYSKHDAIMLLAKWTKAKSQHFLNNLTEKVNRKVNAKYTKLRIRPLKTGWGNCSSDKTISLNYVAIFLPPTLVKHLIIHELCHLRHLDHSPKFWNEVAKFDRSWKKHRVALNEAEMYVPRWIA